MATTSRNSNRVVGLIFRSVASLPVVKSSTSLSICSAGFADIALTSLRRFAFWSVGFDQGRTNADTEGQANFQLVLRGADDILREKVTEDTDDTTKRTTVLDVTRR